MTQTAQAGCVNRSCLCEERSDAAISSPGCHVEDPPLEDCKPAVGPLGRKASGGGGFFELTEDYNQFVAG